MCVVDDAGSEAFTVERALVFVAAVALFVGVCGVVVIDGVGYFLVVFVDYGFHVVHAAVAYFDVVFVEKAVVFVLSWEVFRD